MKSTFLFISLLLFLLFSSNHLVAQTQQDTMYAYLTNTPVVIDGSDSDACWAEADWHPISKVWLPTYGAPMEDGDFSGRFKLAWDSLYLYILVEVTDDSLSDDHVNPLDSYWEDDCVEIFIDENRSKGNHLTNYNAFAYHVSIFYDVIDGGTGTTVNLKDNLTVVMDTIDEHKYRWEFAMKNYDDSYNPNNPEASRVYLHHNKLMGFSLAYCDNDETTGRENFIGSTDMPPNHSNDNYITADYFGTLLLVDPNSTGETSVIDYEHSKTLTVYPNPVESTLIVAFDNELSATNVVEIHDVTGRVVKRMNNVAPYQKMNVDQLKNGIYSIHLKASGFTKSTMFIKR